MKRFLVALVFTTSTFFITTYQAEANNHASGMEFSYRWVRDSTYEFTFVFIRYCLGFTTGAPVNINVQVSSASTSTTSSFILNGLPTWGTGVPSLEPPNMMRCQTGPICYEEYVYRGLWTSPRKANDWVFGYRICCLPVSIPPVNIQNGYLYVECHLNNLDFPDTIHKNISPLFHTRRPNIPGYLTDTFINYPDISVCAGRPQNISQAVRNYDGDRIKYEFFAPESNAGTPLLYMNNYSFVNPISTTGGPFTIDSATGFINFIPGPPLGSGFYLIGIQATEFRKDTFIVGGNPIIQEKAIGYIRRNLSIKIQDSATCADSYYSFSDTVNNSIPISTLNLRCDNNPIAISLTFPFQCASIDSNASHVLLIKNSNADTINIKGAYSGKCNSQNVTQSFGIQLDSALEPGGYKLFFIKGTDGNTLLTECGTELQPFQDTLNIEVTSPTNTDARIIADTLQGSRDTLILECGRRGFRIRLTHPIFCNSIDSNGSDFKLQYISGTSNPDLPIKWSTGYLCNQNLTTVITINLDTTLKSGFYVLSLGIGSDGNSLINKCFKNLDSSSIVIDVPEMEVDAGPDFTLCNGSDTIISIPNNFSTYRWNTGYLNSWTLIEKEGTYWIEVTNQFGCMVSDTVIVTAIDCYVGTDKHHQTTFKIYPNPTSDQIQIDFEQDLVNSSYRLFSVNGDVVAEGILVNSSIDVHGLREGLYILELRNEDSVYRNKVVISKERY